MLIGGSVDHTRVFEGATTIAESGILLPLQRGVQAFVADVGLVFVLQGPQFDYRDAFLAYHRSRGVDWDDETCVGWFPYVSPRGDVLDIPAPQATSKKRMVGDVHVKKWIGVVHVKFKPEPKKMYDEASQTVSSELGSLADFSDPADDKSIFEDDIVDEDAP